MLFYFSPGHPHVPRTKRLVDFPGGKSSSVRHEPPVRHHARVHLHVGRGRGGGIGVVRRKGTQGRSSGALVVLVNVCRHFCKKSDICSRKMSFDFCLVIYKAICTINNITTVRRSKKCWIFSVFSVFLIKIGIWDSFEGSFLSCPKRFCLYRPLSGVFRNTLSTCCTTASTHCCCVFFFR